jgi:flagellar assembly factor FliW
VSITYSHDSEPPGVVLVSEESTEIEFAAGLPGFPTARRFRFEELDARLLPFRRLRSIGGPDIAFTVVEPGLIFPDYSVEIDEDHQAALGIARSEDAVTFVLVTVPPPPLPPTANLLGPIVVNKATGAAAQVVQHRSSYKVAEPLPRAG